MAKPRPMNLVSRNLLSARNDTPQDMSNSSNPVNSKTEQCDVSSGIWKQMRNTSQDPAMHSQVRQQEDNEHVSTWNQEARNDFSDSSGIWKQMRGVATHINSIMQISNYQYVAKVFQHLKDRLGITENSSTVGIEALKTHVLTWRLFMASTMKAAIHLGPSYIENLEAYKNTNFEEFQKLFGITQKLILDHSEEILYVKPIECTTPSCTRSTLSHDQVIKWTKAKVSVCSDSVLCLGKMSDHSEANQKREGQVAEFRMSTSYG